MPHEVFFYDASDDESEAARDLAGTLPEIDVRAPFVVASTHGKVYADALDAVAEPVRPDGGDQSWALELGAAAQKAGADAIVAIGGGRVLDAGKLAAARAGLKVIVVPTQLSHDGLCSPVAVVPNDAGLAESLGAVEPTAVYLSMPTLLRAPVRSFRAGLGDLLANPLSLRDWALAAERGLETLNEQAWEISTEAFLMIEPFLDVSPDDSARDPSSVKTLAQALILSGEAMIASGDSRPASGAEHEISHAIDTVYGGRALHGEQVAFGCIFSVALYGEDTSAFRERLDRLGLPSDPSGLGLSHDDIVKVLLEAPATRPGRFTILEHAGLDETSAADLVAAIWSAG